MSQIGDRKTRPLHSAQAKFLNYAVGGYEVGIARIEADYPAAMDLLKENGYHPLPYQAATTLIEGQLKDALKTNRFWIADQYIPPSRSGLNCFTVSGELTDYSSKDPEKGIDVIPGHHPLSLYVDTDTGTSMIGRRFVLRADITPQYVASVVVGFRPAQDTQKKQLMGRARRA